MFKRVTWFTLGTAVGVTGTVVGYLRARDLARRHLPENVTDAAVRAAELADSGVRVALERSADFVEDLRTTTAVTRSTRRQAEEHLRRQLDQAGL